MDPQPFQLLSMTSLRPAGIDCLPPRLETRFRRASPKPTGKSARRAAESPSTALLRSVQRQPERIRSYFQHAPVRYAA
jgi:hypothetical protein